MTLTSTLSLIRSSLTVFAIIVASHLSNIAQAEATISPGITIDGLACNILNTPNGKQRWSILQYDLSEGTDHQSVVYSTKHDKVIQSVACSADGSQVLFSMQQEVGEDSEIYQLDTSKPESPVQLTDNDINDVDVAMNQDGTVMVWQGKLADSRQAINIRRQEAGGSYNTIQLSSEYGYSQPYLSTNGEWLIMLQHRPNTSIIVRYQLSSKTYTVLATRNNGRQQLSNPSISNDGNQALWLEMGVEQNLVLTDLTTGERKVELRRNASDNLIEHPSLTGDGQGVLYSVNREDKRQTIILVLATGQTIRLGKALHSESRYLANQLHANLKVNAKVRKFNVTGTSSTSMTRVAKGSDGSLYSLTRSSTYGDDSFIEKYDINGNPVWRTQLENENPEDFPFLKDIEYMFFSDLVVDEFGSIYLSGWASTIEVDGVGTDWEDEWETSRNFLVKYSPNGSKLWVRFVEDGDEHPSPILALAPEGGAYLVTTYEKWFGTDVYIDDYTCVIPNCDPTKATGISLFNHYDANGNQRFTKVYLAPEGYGYNTIDAVNIDSKGNIFLSTSRSIEPYWFDDGWVTELSVVKLDQEAEFIWTKPIASGNSDDGYFGSARYVNLDKSGGIYVSLNASLLMGEQDFGMSDIVVLKLSADGELQYATQLGSIENDYIRDTAVDTEGNLYVTGVTYGNFPELGNRDVERDIFVLKYSPEGLLIKSYQFGLATPDDVYYSMINGDDELSLIGHTEDLGRFGAQNVVGGGFFLMDFMTN